MISNIADRSRVGVLETKAWGYFHRVWGQGGLDSRDLDALVAHKARLGTEAARPHALPGLPWPFSALGLAKITSRCGISLITRPKSLVVLGETKAMGLLS
jgi:hypothetical protein